MAISYSYPMGTPKLTDTVLGVQYEEMKDPAVKNFSIDDIVALAMDEVVIPTLQVVTDYGNETTNSIKATQLVTQTNGPTKSMALSSNNVNSERTAEWQDKDYTGIADITDIPAPTYKVYVALLTQSGAFDPAVIELENTIGPITITRTGTGAYRIASSALFTLNKTTFDITPIQGFIKQDQLNSVNTIPFETRDTGGVASDGLLPSKKLEIRVYN